MCGIAGIILQSGEGRRLSVVMDMTRTIRHRGPDDEGYAFFSKDRQPLVLGGPDTPESVFRLERPHAPRRGPGFMGAPGAVCALGHRRLSILDLSPAGHQPMATPDGRFWIVFNGEIYNYLELGKEIAALGVNLLSRSDTEVLLHAFALWGTRAFTRLVGMFALAVYDTRENHLWLARDFFGIKPLYYVRWPGGLAFASEIKALLALPWVPRRLDAQRTLDYLGRAITDRGQNTLLVGVHQIPAAHFLKVDGNRPEEGCPVRYWELSPIDVGRPSRQEAAVRVRELFLDNIGLHLRSDVPVGAALSGGIDSTAVVCAMRKSAPEMDLHAFSFVAEDPRFDEEEWAELAARASRAKLHKVHADAEDLVRDLDRLILLQDEPFGGTSIYAQFRVMKRAAESGIKVMLDGQGADELLAGYTPFRAARLASLVRSFSLVRFLAFLGNLARLEGIGALSTLARAGGAILPPSLRPLARAVSGRAAVPGFLRMEWFSRQGASLSHGVETGPDYLRQALILAATDTGLAGLLRYEDRNSMAFSIESRVPFLTPALAEYLISLPEEYLLDEQGVSKRVFRDAMAGLAPAEILGRRDKIGFATPQDSWLSTLAPWVEEVLKNQSGRAENLVRQDLLSEHWQRVVKRDEGFDFSLWRCLNFFRWADLLGVEVEG